MNTAVRTMPSTLIPIDAAEINRALAAMLARAPEHLREVNRFDHLTFAASCQDDSDLDALSELYVDGEDIETDYDLLDGMEPFDV